MIARKICVQGGCRILKILGCISMLSGWIGIAYGTSAPPVSLPEELACIAIPNFADYSANKRRTGRAIANMATSQLLAATQYRLMEPDELTQRMSEQNIVLSNTLSIPQALWLGKLVGVDAVLIGEVLEYSYLWVDKLNVGSPTVTLRAKLLSVATKEIIWSAEATQTGSGWFNQGKHQPLTLLAQQALVDLLKRLPPAHSAKPIDSSNRHCGATTLTADLDKDGVLNLADRCPLVAENNNGVDDYDGCPEIVTSDQNYLEFLSLVGDRIVLKTPIEFARNEMKLLKSSHPGLKKLAEYLQKNRQFRKIMIEGFGPAGAGKAASERFSFDRATLVKEFLVRAGVDVQRLIAVGYGQVERTSIQEIEFTIVE